MQELLIPAATSVLKDKASTIIKNRSLLYDTDEKELYVKYGDSLHDIGGGVLLNRVSELETRTPEYDTLTLNNDKDDDSVTPQWKGGRIIGRLANNKCLLLMKKNLADEHPCFMGGELLIDINNGYYYDHHSISLSSTGSCSFWGASNNPVKTHLAQITYNEQHYYGVLLPSILPDNEMVPETAVFYFNGWENISDELKPPTNYTDSDLSNITPIVGQELTFPQQIFNAAHPIGEVYTQYPQTENPNILFNNNDITSAWMELNYNGCFFRASGGDASEFNSGVQEEGLPNVTNALGFTNTPAGSLINIYDTTEDGNTVDTEFSADKGETNSNGLVDSNEPHVYGASDHITPVNQTIKIWKRVA